MTLTPLVRNFLLLALSLACTLLVQMKEAAAQKGDAKCAIVIVQLDAGLLNRTYEAAQRNSDCWVESICASISSFDRAEYERFVALVLQESTPREVVEQSNKAHRSRHFSEYTTNDNGGRAFQCLERKGERSSAESQFALYQLIQSSPQRPPASPTKWLKKAAVGGVPMAQYQLSELILRYDTPSKGNLPGTPPEILDENTPDNYINWLQKAADGEVARAQYALGRLRLGMVDRKWAQSYVDIPDAVKWLERAAKQSGDEVSRNNAAARLGELYFSGEKVQRNYQEALRWFNLVDAKYMSSCSQLVWVRRRLIQIYESGLGVEKNPEKVKAYSKTPTACI